MVAIARQLEAKNGRAAMNQSCLCPRPHRAPPALLSGNSRLGKFFLDSRLRQLEDHLSRGGLLGSDGASLGWTVDAFVDPIGITGGLNLYGYVGNSPVNGTDPSGLSHRIDLGTRIISVQEQNLPTLYYGPSDMARFFVAITGQGISHLSGILQYYPTNYIWGSEAEFSPLMNALRLRTTVLDTDPLILIHEMVHSVDDANGWYLGAYSNNKDSAEALAWGAQHLLSTSTIQLRGFDKSVRALTTIDQDTWLGLQSRWNGVWSSFAAFPEFVTDAGLLNLRVKLALHFSCSELLPVYQAVIDRIAGAGRCVLSCSKDLPSSLK